MQIIDLHCDALLKLWQSNGTLTYRNAAELDSNLGRLVAGEILVQCFAIYVPTDVKTETRFQTALEQIYLFQTEVLEKNPEIKQIKNWNDFDQLKNGEIGAMLTLEGVEAIGHDLEKLEVLYQHGVRSVGLTWNHANLAADGALEPRGAGLTVFGKEIVCLNNEHQILTDVSHLSEKAFWDVMDLAMYPIASHSNAKSLVHHPRNLSDEQAKAMFDKDAMIHVVYCPMFVKESGASTIQDVIRHIDHFCSIGGVRNIGLGSDFDGISEYVEGLENAAMSQNLINELLKHFTEAEVRGFASENFLRCRPASREKSN